MLIFVYNVNWSVGQFLHCMNMFSFHMDLFTPGNYSTLLCWIFVIGYFVDGFSKRILLLNSICMLYCLWQN